MADIFISYASSDRPRAERLAQTLQQEGWTVWWDRDIPFGKKFDEVIEEALATAKCVIVLWTHDSVKSQWVKAEASEGLRRRILIPILADDTKVPLEFRGIQAARLDDWDNLPANPDWDQVVLALAALVGPRAHADSARTRTSTSAKPKQMNSPLAPNTSSRQSDSSHVGFHTDMPQGEIRRLDVPDVFISYAEEDENLIVRMVRALEAEGYRAWYYARDSYTGPSYLEQVAEAIGESQAIVLIISPNSIGSDQIGKEVEWGHEQGKRFIPLLSGMSYVEFQKHRVRWRMALGTSTMTLVTADGFSEAVQRLVRGLQKLGIKPSGSRITRV